MSRLKNTLNILVLFLLTSILFANQENFTLPSGVSIYQLDNGIELLLIENPGLPMVGVNTVVKVGSAYETFSTSGMSHMLEHLLFNGTSTMTQRELYDYTDKIGGYNNANTSEYYTNFMMVTPSDKIIDGMKIQASMLFDSILPNEKFEKEKGIVLEEIAKSLANSNEQLNRNIIDVIFDGHALSLPTLGTYETIKNMDRDDVYNFYKNNYVPNNMLISVIGNFNTKEMLKSVNEIYGKAAPGNVVRPNISDWGTGFELPKSEKTLTISHRFYNAKATHLQHFYAVGNYSTDFFDLLDISLDKLKDNLVDKLKAKFPDEIENLSFSSYIFPIKNVLEVDVELKKEDNLDKISHFVNEELKKLDLKLSNEIVSAEAIKKRTAFLKQIEKPHMFGIYNANVIAQKGLEAILNEFSSDRIFLAAKELSNYKISETPQIIIQHPELSEATEGNTKTAAKLFNNNGNRATVIAMQNPVSDLLAIHYMFKNKSDYEKSYGNDVAKKWHEAFGNRMKTSENQKRSGEYGLSFVVNDNPFIPMDNIYLSPTFGYIRVEGLGNNIEGAINYLNTEMMNFIPTEEEFNAVNKAGMGSMMMGRKNKSKEMYNDAYESLVLEPIIETKDVKILDYQKFLEFGKEYFTPSNVIISVVSKEVPEKINEYFSKFKKASSLPRKNNLADERGFKLWDEAKKIEKDGGGEQSYTFYGFVKIIDKSDKAALTILSLMLSDDIAFNIREKQGLAYRMGSGIKIVNDKALVYVNVPTQPKNVEMLIPQFPGLFNTEFADDKTESDIEKTVNMYLGKMMFRRLSSINQAYYLAHSLYFDGDISSDEKELEALKNIKLEDIQRVAKKYLKAENPVEIIIH